MHVQSSEGAGSWTREFARPLPVVAVIVLALNDHVLKRAHVLPGWLTGKLSDVAGLFFFPVLLFALSAALLGKPRGRIVRASILALATAVAFAFIKVVPAANALANRIIGDVTLDPSDLVALPFAVASVVYLRRPPRVGAQRGEVARRAAVVFAAIASIATSAPQLARNYPFWQVRGATHQSLACVEISLEIVKAGKSGLGAVVTRDVDPGCDVRVEGARVHIAHSSFPALTVPAWDDSRSIYLGFSFDSEALWNAGERQGTLELDVRANGEHRTLVFPMTHEWTGPHRNSRRPPPSVKSPSTPNPAPVLPLAAPEPETDGDR